MWKYMSEADILSKLLESVCIKSKEAALEKYSIHSVSGVLVNHYPQSTDKLKMES